MSTSCKLGLGVKKHNTHVNRRFHVFFQALLQGLDIYTLPIISMEPDVRGGAGWLIFRLKKTPNVRVPCGYESRFSHQGTAGFSRWFHLPGFPFGYRFFYRQHCEFVGGQLIILEPNGSGETGDAMGQWAKEQDERLSHAEG